MYESHLLSSLISFFVPLPISPIIFFPDRSKVPHTTSSAVAAQGERRARRWLLSHLLDSPLAVRLGGRDDTFSDGLARISSSDLLTTHLARLSSVDSGATSRRLWSFIMDRSSANAHGQLVILAPCR